MDVDIFLDLNLVRLNAHIRDLDRVPVVADLLHPLGIGDPA